MTEEEGLVNWNKSLEIVGGDEALLADVAPDFLTEAAMRLTGIRQGIDDRNAELLRRSAHTTASLLRTFDSPAARDLAYQLEEMGKNSAFDEAPPLLAELEPLMAKIIGTVKARFGL
jgi:HPt (histidine-containing phosphotransfer) domain-containing protein